MKQPRMALIDLDGTLVDSVPDLAFCADEMNKTLGLPVRGEQRARNWVGNGVERFVKRALTDSLHDEPEPVLLEQALPIFMGLYAENTSARSRLYPGVREGLDYLQSKGIALGCVTNKAARFTEPLLRELGIYDCFGIVVSGDTLPQKKPDPAPLRHAADFFKVPEEASLMIGDSMHDVEAARNAGFSVIAVTYGYNHGHDIREANPDAVVDSLAELPQVLED
ncbi:phosphoglycolate phosphatase [Thiohalomonas denitrificans]|uniref:phosphoglycolate phosphatase n=1 Tax=Thiohalomonas denitrificans TaxID=415747 RepID=UPI0026EF79E6|nr:phosphoglycolate phosphatase [Thiohalomonas denitrificans]